MGAIDSSHWINAFAILIIYSCQQKVPHIRLFIYVCALFCLFLVAFERSNENINTQVAPVPLSPISPYAIRIHNTHSPLTSHSFRTIGTTSTISNTNNNRRHVYYRTLFPFGFRLWIIKTVAFLRPLIYFAFSLRNYFLFYFNFFLIWNHTRMVWTRANRGKHTLYATTNESNRKCQKKCLLPSIWFKCHLRIWWVVEDVGLCRCLNERKAAPSVQNFLFHMHRWCVEWTNGIMQMEFNSLDYFIFSFGVGQMIELSATGFPGNIQRMVWLFHTYAGIDAPDSSAPSKMILHSTAANRRVDILHWVQQSRRHSLAAAAFSNISRRQFRWLCFCVRSLLWFRCTNGRACIGDAFSNYFQYIVIQTFPVKCSIIVILWLHAYVIDANKLKC